MFKAPRWLRDIGLMAWLVVGVGVLLVGAVWVLSLTQVIVAPVIAAAVVAAVASPVVAWLERHRMPRAASAVLLLLALVLLAGLVTVVVLAGITSEAGDLKKHLAEAKQTIEGWLKDLGVDPSKAKSANKDASSSSTDAVSALLQGVGTGVEALSSLVFFLAMTALSTLFLLKDGPTIRAWVERHMGVPAPLARLVSRRGLQSLRGYFLGVTVVAAFNAVVVLVGALVLGVPLAGTIAAVTFLAAYVPYLGAWAAGAFAVLLALGGAGPEAAAGMIVVQLLANSVLQQLVQPFAMGSALGIHPLAVLIVTIAGGALFGAVGLILAAPVTATVVRVSADLSGAEPDPTAASP
ncbi:MAG TPA: AI-2E family transporter [Thermoleophilaceae bacterium]|nr:AI-2E family transporter [Thermoleophilaceae bacterium]